MRPGNVTAVARRELGFYFASPIAYSVLTVFLVGAGVWLFVGTDFFEMNRATVRPLFEVVPIIFAVVLPAVTMRLISEEKRSGTMELLITMPVTDGDIVLGKYLASLTFLLILLAMSAIFPLIVSTLGDLDGGLVLAGYVGLFLVGASYLALGLMTSTWTRYQILAFFLAAVLALFFYSVNGLLALAWEGARDTFAFLSVKTHFANIARGVIDTRDVVFYLSLIAVPLVIAVQSLQSRNWK